MPTGPVTVATRDPEQSPPISRQLSTLSDTIDRTAQNLLSLRSNLDPILGPEDPPQAKQNADKVPSMNGSLVITLRELTARVVDIDSQIDEINGRLEI